MADDTRGPGNGLYYGLLGALCIVVAGGGLYVYEHRHNLDPIPWASVPPPRSIPAPTLDDVHPDRTGQRDNGSRIAKLVGEARAAMARRDYSAADHALDEAERIDAGDPVVIRARNELLEAAAR